MLDSANIWFSKKAEQQFVKQKSTANVLIIGIGGKHINDATDNLVKGHAKKVIYDIQRWRLVSFNSRIKRFDSVITLYLTS